MGIWFVLFSRLLSLLQGFRYYLNTYMHITLLLAVIPQHASGAPVPVAATAANWSMIIMMEHRYAGDGAVPFTPPPLR